MNIVSVMSKDFCLVDLEKRQPKGIGVSPYSFFPTIRCVMNNVFNGYFSYINPDRDQMQLLKLRNISEETAKQSKFSKKIAFLGDVMVTRDGKFPKVSPELKKVLQEADIIFANIEAPVSNKEMTKRTFSLNFEMSNKYLLDMIKSCNEHAQWVLSIGNNHAGDNSKNSQQDISGIEATIQNILSICPEAKIIGAEIQGSYSVLSFKLADGGPTIGATSWTEVMNNDRLHYQKPIIRETDLTKEKVQTITEKHDFLIGFPHANEEQSYYALKETRDRWIKDLPFDAIVGHGPHVLLSAEKIEGKVIFHSIGNFCSSVGKAQTKIGGIPILTFYYNSEKDFFVDYDMKVLEQQEGLISIIDVNKGNQHYPHIINRLKTIWGDLFENAPKQESTSKESTSDYSNAVEESQSGGFAEVVFKFFFDTNPKGIY